MVNVMSMKWKLLYKFRFILVAIIHQIHYIVNKKAIALEFNLRKFKNRPCLRTVFTFVAIIYSPRTFSTVASLTAIANSSAASFISSTGGNEGAILIFLSSGSLP